MKDAGQNWGKWVVVTLVLGVLAFLASPNAPLGGFWGPTAASPGAGPSDTQRMLFMLIGAFQSLVFGWGVAFLIFGFPFAKDMAPAHQGLARAAHLAIAWSLINWWPHGNFHITLGARSVGGLLAIEYGFHVTTIVAALVMACFFMTVMRQRATQAR